MKYIIKTNGNFKLIGINVNKIIVIAIKSAPPIFRDEYFSEIVDKININPIMNNG